MKLTEIVVVTSIIVTSQKLESSVEKAEIWFCPLYQHVVLLQFIHVSSVPDRTLSSGMGIELARRFSKAYPLFCEAYVNFVTG